MVSDYSCFLYIPLSMSMGTGNIMVEFFSHEIELRVCRYLTRIHDVIIRIFFFAISNQSKLSPELHGGVVAGYVVTGGSQGDTGSLLPLGSNHLVIIIIISDIIISE